MGTLHEFRALGERMQGAAHEKTRALAVEFLNDWEAIFRVLAPPHWPLTNNEAEQALRHWAIGRRVSDGTRTPVGSRAFARLASLMEWGVPCHPPYTGRGLESAFDAGKTGAEVSNARLSSNGQGEDACRQCNAYTAPEHK